MSITNEPEDDRGEDEITLRVALGGDEFETLRAPVSELRPVTTTDRFKQAVGKLLEEQKKNGGEKWTTEWLPAATSKEEYIKNAGKLDYVRSLATRRPSSWSNPNLLAYRNSGGVLDMGVCWWHSRFTRAGLYLAYFLPSAPKPSDGQAKDIIATLMAADDVVAIPGYSCMEEFSKDHWGAIQKRLEQTQLIEGLFLFSWVDGLSGASELPPDKMKEQMDEIYAEVRDNGIAYVKLQIPGIDAHAWLITDMEPRGKGYRYQFIDSNFDAPGTYVYEYGDKKIDLAFFGDLGVPYLQRTSELRRMKRAIARFIKRETEA